MLVSLSQIPVLPLMTLMLAQWDRGHEVLIEQNQGVITVILRHGDVHEAHTDALDLWIQAAGHADTDPDHKMSFSHSNVLGEESRSHFESSLIASYRATLQEWDASISTKSMTDDEFVVNYDKYHRISAIPRGLRQTVLLV